jgi:hypothetical protein
LCLGWSQYKLAKEIARLRGEPADSNAAKRFGTTVKQAIATPDKSSMETLERIVKAMGGELFIRWEEKENVVTGYTEIKVSDD